MNQYFVSIIRTWVPILFGWLLSQLALLGVDLGDNAMVLETGITALVIALYYAAARWLEQRFPQAGALLGYIRQPVYVNPTQTPAEQRTEVKRAVKEVAKTPENPALDNGYEQPQYDAAEEPQQPVE